MEQPGITPLPGGLVSRSAVTAATLVFSAPTPGSGSRYRDGRVAHEARVLSAFAAGGADARAAEWGVGGTVLWGSRAGMRSEERRVGEECRSRWAAAPSKKMIRYH